jgi:predicted protein tyrosine phosphatase
MNVTKGLPTNLHNENQGPYKRVLCVCMGGLLRSPTLAWLLSQPPYKCNTRAAGIDSSYAVVDVTPKLIAWADEIICFEWEHHDRLCKMCAELGLGTLVTCLDIGDWYGYRNEKLIDQLIVKLAETEFNYRLARHNFRHKL